MKDALAEKQVKTDYWREVFKRWQESGQSQEDFCLKHDVSFSQFKWWRKRIKDLPVAIEQPVTPNETSSFIPVQVSTEDDAESTWACEIESCGLKIRLRDASWEILYRIIHANNRG